MKKRIAFLLAVVLVIATISLCSCGNSAEQTSDETNSHKPIYSATILKTDLSYSRGVGAVAYAGAAIETERGTEYVYIRLSCQQYCLLNIGDVVTVEFMMAPDYYVIVS